jgi:tRNA(fMet)-specific endonuclease VapC
VFALDTNTLIYYFKGMGNVPQRFLATSPKEVGIPAIVLYEIENGILGSGNSAKRRQTLRELLDVVSVLPFDRRAAEIAAGTKSDLQKKGVAIGPLDLLIAGTALSHARILVTHNTQEFSRVSNLQLADWF